MNKKKLFVMVGILVAILAFFIFDLGQFFTLEYLKQQQSNINDYYQAQPSLTALIYFVVYIAVTALSLPGAAVMTLFGGAIFGLGAGLVIVSFASTIGATLAFLVSRFLLRDSVQQRFGDNLKNINQGIEKEGPFYLFTLRLVPAFPFFVINLVMGLTKLPARTFFWVSQLGMLPGTIVFVNAGKQLSEINSLAGILSPGLIFSFVILGIFPLVAKKAIDAINARKVYKKWTKPERFEYDMVVIGAGAGGLVSAYIASAVKAKVALIEKHKMGGDCLNTGCVPSKALIRSAKFLSHQTRSKEFGIAKAEASFNFAEVMERVQSVITKIEPHDSVERYTDLGVECLQGEATITSPFTVEVDGQTLTTRNIVIAAGARPFVPPIEGLDKVQYYTSDTLWDLREQPKQMVILGGGPIGTELTQSFARLGTHVTQIEMLPRIMIREDEEISAIVEERLTLEGVNVLTSTKATAVRVDGDKQWLMCERDGETIEVAFDTLLIAVGRIANTTGYGLEALDITLSARKTIETNALQQTNYPNIYAVGDVAGPYQFTHTAAHQAWYAAVNALFGTFKTFKTDYSVIPWATFTDPEVARVGLNEQEAKEQGIAYEVTIYGIDDLDRAIADSEAHGLVKVLTPPGSDRILGVTIVGEHAGDLIAEFVLAMKHKLGLNKLLGTIHIYPTLAESNKYVAGNWKRAHKPEKLLQWVERYHAWRRN